MYRKDYYEFVQRETKHCCLFQQIIAIMKKKLYTKAKLFRKHIIIECDAEET